jgi:hypothetical protein
MLPEVSRNIATLVIDMFDGFAVATEGQQVQSNASSLQELLQSLPLQLISMKTEQTIRIQNTGECSFI